MAKQDNSENKLLIIPTSVLRKLYSHDSWDDEKKKIKKKSLIGTDAVQLYTFLYFTSNWQIGVGNQLEATNSYCMRHFKWGKLRYLAAENVLKAEGLIEKIRKVGSQGKVIGWFVRLPYKASLQTENDLETRSSVENHWSTKTRGSADHLVARRTTNTNSTNKLNTDSTFAKPLMGDLTVTNRENKPALDTSLGTVTELSPNGLHNLKNRYPDKSEDDLKSYYTAAAADLFSKGIYKDEEKTIAYAMVKIEQDKRKGTKPNRVSVHRAAFL